MSITTPTASQNRVPQPALTVVLEPLEQGHERLRRRDLLQRLNCWVGHERVGHQREQRADGLPRADLTERGDGRELEPQVLPEHTQQRRHRLDARSRPSASMADWATFASGWRSSGRIAGAERAAPAPRQHLQHEHDDFVVLGAEHLLEIRHRVRALPLQCGDRRVPEHRVDIVGHEGAQDVGLDVARGQPDGGVAHRDGGVLHGGDDRRLPLRAVPERVQRRQALRDGHTRNASMRLLSVSDSLARCFAAAGGLARGDQVLPGHGGDRLDRAHDHLAAALLLEDRLGHLVGELVHLQRRPG